MSYFPTTKIEFANSGAIDAFARLRVSNPVTLFDSTHQYNASPLFWEATVTNGSVTHSANSSAVTLSTGGTASGNKAYWQTRSYFRYQPGKSLLLVFTLVPGTAVSNLRRRWGYFDASNGLFFEQTSGGLSVVRRTNTSGTPTDNAVAQASWNVDPLDGTGPSGFNLDVTKANIFWVDIEWLGVGRVRMGVFSELGMPIIAHEFRNANSLTVPYMTTANLPLRFEIENTGTTSGTNTMLQICSSVISEGGIELDRGRPGGAGNGVTSISVTTRRAVLSIRPKDTFNSIVNRGLIIPEDFNVYAKTNDSLIEIVYDGTLGGSPSWTSAGTNSIVEYDVAGTTVTGGEVIHVITAVTGQNALVTHSGDALASKLPMVLNAAGTAGSGKVLSIVATSFSGTSGITASMNWREIY